MWRAGPSRVYVLHLVLFVQVFFLYQHSNKKIVHLRTKVLAWVVRPQARDMVVTGDIQIPGVPFSSRMLAVMQNVTVDQRFIYSKSRVRSSISTDTGGREPLSYEIPYEWFHY